MKYSSKIILFIVTMAITFGALAATVGRHRHHWKGRHMNGCHEGKSWNGHHRGPGHCDENTRNFKDHGPARQQLPAVTVPVPKDSVK